MGKNLGEAPSKSETTDIYFRDVSYEGISLKRQKRLAKEGAEGKYLCIRNFLERKYDALGPEGLKGRKSKEKIYTVSTSRLSTEHGLTAESERGNSKRRYRCRTPGKATGGIAKTRPPVFKLKSYW